MRGNSTFYKSNKITNPYLMLNERRNMNSQRCVSRKEVNYRIFLKIYINLQFYQNSKIIINLERRGVNKKEKSNFGQGKCSSTKMVLLVFYIIF